MPKSALLKNLHPEVFQQLHPTLNKALGIDVDFLICTSDEIVVWYCPNSKCYHDHVYSTSVSHKIRGLKNCPYCIKSTSMRRICTCDSFAVQRPDLMEEYDWEKNNKQGIDPYQLTIKSHCEINWICLTHTTCRHTWVAVLASRIGRTCGCPYCRNLYVCKCKSLLVTHPHFEKQFDPQKNPGIDLANISHGSDILITWKCNDHTDCDEHVWISPPSERTREDGARHCPFCSFRRACSCRNLAKLFPEVYKEIDKENNPGIDFTKLSPFSNVRLNWKCSTCSHTWSVCVCSRTSEGPKGCPKCRESHMEKECERVLKNLGVPYKREVHFSDCKDKRTLYFDFGVFDENALIELDGAQHFIEVAFTKNSATKSDLEGVQRRDAKKNLYCKEKQKGLLRISYTEIKNIELYVTEYIQELRSGSRPIRFIGKEYTK